MAGYDACLQRFYCMYAKIRVSNDTQGNYEVKMKYIWSCFFVLLKFLGLLLWKYWIEKQSEQSPMSAILSAPFGLILKVNY